MNEPLSHPQRRSIRLKSYDYSHPGAYFITICTDNRQLLFGEILFSRTDQVKMRLNPFGSLVQSTWDDLPNHISNIALGPFVVMPNHVHGIIHIVGPVMGDRLEGTSLSEVVRQFKTFSAKRINKLRETPGIDVWQRNYWEHVIRNEMEMERITAYIQTNPAQWRQDKLFPENSDSL